MTAYIRQARRLPKRASGKARVVEGRHGASKDAFRRSVVPTDVRKREALRLDVAKAVSRTDQRKTLARRKVDANLSTAAGAAGIASTGLFALSQAKGPGRVGRWAAPRKAKLERASLGTAVGVGGFAGYNTIRSANTSRRLIRQEEKEKRLQPLAKAAPRFGMPAPTGLLRRKSYAASSIRTTQTGRLVRTRAGVR